MGINKLAKRYLTTNSEADFDRIYNYGFRISLKYLEDSPWFADREGIASQATQDTIKSYCRNGGVVPFTKLLWRVTQRRRTDAIRKHNGRRNEKPAVLPYSVTGKDMPEPALPSYREPAAIVIDRYSAGRLLSLIPAGRRRSAARMVAVGYTQQAVAKFLGCSESRVSQIMKSARENLLMALQDGEEK